MGKICPVEQPFGRLRPSAFIRAVWQFADARRFSPRVRRVLRRFAASLGRGPYDVDHAGFRLRVYPAENYCDRLVFARGKLPEADERAALEPYLKDASVFVDIGANVGTYALFAVANGSAELKVLALEPDPRTAQKLRFNLAANDARGVAVIQMAAGEAAGALPLWPAAGGNAGGNSLVGEGQGEAAVMVDVAPLPDILERHGFERVDVIKADVEGFEDRALLPLFEAWPKRRWPRAVQIETTLADRWQSDVVRELTSRGYVKVFDSGENVLMVQS